ncbi:MAG: glycoside hydrolase family 9 protein [Hyphomonas sp.]|uniref:glycoside hydrolase family 9 protein n=1 Tax=Hyphomonas sp. TaxID=87 RepID=UPI0035280CBF
MTGSVRQQGFRSTGYGLAAGALMFLGACATAPERPSGMANGAEVVVPKVDQYIEAFNAPRGPVRISQTGFRPGFPVLGVVETDAAEPRSWSVHTDKGKVIASGMTVPFGGDTGSGAAVQSILMESGLPAGGPYVLTVEGVGDSHPFRVSDHVFHALKYDLLNYYYHNRAGIPIEAKYAGGEAWARPAGQPRETLTCFRGKDMNGIAWPGCDYTLDVHGGWYDAGDQSKYAVNAGVTMWTLFNAYEVGFTGFEDGKVKLPEAGNGQNDLLDEVRFNMDWMLRMQAPEGAKAAVARGMSPDGAKGIKPEVIDVSGMVHHKEGTVKWPPVPMMPHEDDTPRALYPPSTTATLHLAATGAQCARIYKSVDAAFSARCLEAAKRAYAAAQRVPDAYSYNNFTGNGPYSSTDPRNEFYWAAAELYATTGDAAFLADLQAAEASLEADPAGQRQLGWSDTEYAGVMTLARFAPDEAVKAAGRAKLKTIADAYLAQRPAEGYGIAYTKEKWPWGSVGELANRGVLLATVYEFTGDKSYRNAALDMLDYILGRNPRDISYVSGHGANAFKAPHHRVWAGANYPGWPLPPPGAVSGGSNNQAIAGPVSAAFADNCHAQTCYADHVDAYELNEVAINWQSAVFWLAAWADEVDRT